MQIFQPGLKYLKVTIGAAATQFTTDDIPVTQVLIQNNQASNSFRVGDTAVSSTQGVKLLAGGSMNLGPFRNRELNLNQLWVAGTQNDVVDVLYVQ